MRFESVRVVGNRSFLYGTQCLSSTRLFALQTERTLADRDLWQSTRSGFQTGSTPTTTFLSSAIHAPVPPKTLTKETF